MAEAMHSVADEVGADPEVRRFPIVRRDTSMGQGLARTDPQVRRAPSTGNLYEVLDLILDKGIVIDAFIRVSVVGIELLTIDTRIVIASVDTYLRYAEAANRLRLYERQDKADIQDFTQGGQASKAMKEGAQGIGRALSGQSSGGENDEGDDDKEEGVGSKVAHSMRHVLRRGVGRIMEKISGEDHGFGDDDDEQDDEQGSSRGKDPDRDRDRGQHSRRHRSSSSSSSNGGGGGGGRAKAGRR